MAFYEKHKKVILHRILQQDATAAELYAKNKEEVERAQRYGMEDVVSQDFNIRTALFKLVKDVGYEQGLDDDTTEVCLKKQRKLMRSRLALVPYKRLPEDRPKETRL